MRNSGLKQQKRSACGDGQHNPCLCPRPLESGAFGAEGTCECRVLQARWAGWLAFLRPQTGPHCAQCQGAAPQDTALSPGSACVTFGPPREDVPVAFCGLERAPRPKLRLGLSFSTYNLRKLDTNVSKLPPRSINSLTLTLGLYGSLGAP